MTRLFPAALLAFAFISSAARAADEQDPHLAVPGRLDLAPDAKEVKSGGKWTRPVGFTLAGAGLLMAGIGAYQGAHSKSLVDDANRRYRNNKGAYLQGDLATISSAKKAANTANVLFVVAAVLAAAGLTMSLAF